LDCHPLERALAEAWPPAAWRDVTVLLAVSGGADSVAMLRAMTALRTDGPGRLCVVHLNHQLRGQESADDEAFVVELCRQLGIPHETGQVDASGLAGNSRDGLEAAARKARYDFFRETADRLGARYVVTAHTADDQAETILHRILRGTGVAGLSGMARARPLGSAVTLIRPFLAIRRREILGYLEELRQPYRQDASNVDVQFTRNRIRHQLLPNLAEHFNPAVVEALLRLGSMAGEVQTVIDAIVSDLADRCVSRQPSGAVLIDVPKLGTQPRHLLRELLIAAWRQQGWPLQSMGFAEWDLLADMLSADADRPRPAPRKHTFPGGISAELVDENLRLVPSPHQPTGTKPP
jgi:tRNA(Ile)-lysidine synthase